MCKLAWAQNSFTVISSATNWVWAGNLSSRLSSSWEDSRSTPEELTLLILSGVLFGWYPGKMPNFKTFSLPISNCCTGWDSSASKKPFPWSSLIVGGLFLW